MTAVEARRHATLTAILLWLVAAVAAFAGSGYRSVFGPLKGSDFIHFYTLGHIDRQTARTVMYDVEALHRLQTTLVPESAPEHYPTVYPPHASLLFRPFTRLPYGAAALLWAAILALAYAACVWCAWRPFSHVLRDRRLIVAAAAAFPPFWFLVLHGQTGVVPLIAFCLAYAALRHRQPFWAGAAFGLLLLKPQFALVLIPVLLVWREWATVAGALVAVTLQLLAIAALLGPGILSDYAMVVADFPRINHLLEPRPDQMHSITAITNRLPDGWSALTWLILSFLVILQTARVWRPSNPIAVRVGILVLASVLVNPHVFVYDATVLAPALVWFAGWVYGNPGVPSGMRSRFGLVLYAVFIAFLAPTAAFLPIQFSVVLLGALFVLITRTLDAAPTGRLVPSWLNVQGADFWPLWRRH